MFSIGCSKKFNGSKKKISKKCPWDLGPNQHLAKEKMDIEIREVMYTL